MFPLSQNLCLALNLSQLQSLGNSSHILKINTYVIKYSILQASTDISNVIKIDLKFKISI